MQTREQRRLYEELELINRQEPEIKTIRQKGLFKALQTGWQSAIAFLTQEYKPQTTQGSKLPICPTDFAECYTFSWQAGHYALMFSGLSSEEDVKAWLEKSYHRKPNNPWVI